LRADKKHNAKGGNHGEKERSTFGKYSKNELKVRVGQGYSPVKRRKPGASKGSRFNMFEYEKKKEEVKGKLSALFLARGGGEAVAEKAP